MNTHLDRSKDGNSSISRPDYITEWAAGAQSTPAANPQFGIGRVWRAAR